MDSARTADSLAVDEGRLLLELTREVTSTLDLQEVLDRTFAALRRLIDFGGGAIQLIEDGLLAAAATDPPATAEAMSVRIPLGQGVSGTIAATGEPIYIPDIWEDPRVHPEGRAKGVSTGVRSYFGVPLILRGTPIGVVQIDSPNEDAFSPDMRARLLAFLPAVAAAVQNAHLFLREREALARLQEAEQLKRDFLALVPHELRTPLTSIAGFGYTLARHADKLDTATVTDIGERIWRASRRLERVMVDLLDMSHIERGIMTFSIMPTAIESLLREAAREYTDADHLVTFEVESDLPLALVDGRRLLQIVTNLLDNARKFSPPGTPVELRAAREDAHIVLSITDYGRGIPATLHERIFESFFQAEAPETRTAEGLGVGLHLVKQMCDRMAATIRVDSEPDGGTRFTVRIPVAA